MQKIGTYSGRKVYWYNYGSFPSELPDINWIYLATAGSKPDVA